MGENIFFQNVCRICTNETNHMSIYSEEGKRNSLEDKIKKFLSITVSEEDILPKMVCSLCASKLNSMDQFASMAAKMQTKLLECLNSQVGNDVGAGMSFKHCDRMALWQSQFTKDEASIEESPRLEPKDAEHKDDLHGSLLHSILTKGQAQGDEADVTELEVRVDPMLFLCDQDDDDHSNDESIPSPVSSPSNENTDSSDSQGSTGSQQGVEDKPFQCALCPRGFSSDAGLQGHLWTHLPPTRKILVNSDLNRFQTQTNLYRHKMYHSGAQCLCQVCGRVYPTRSTLRAHQITHSNLRPHKCSLCEKTFKRNQDLKFHINQHTGERPYRCPYCPKAFASSGNCFSHRKRMHPKQLARDKSQLLGPRY